MSEPIRPITMPKWGLAMTEGTIAAWLVEEGSEIAPGAEIVEIETTKITSVFESPVSRRLPGGFRRPGGGDRRTGAGA